VHTLIRVGIRLLYPMIDLNCFCSPEIVNTISLRLVVGLRASIANVEDSRNNSYNIFSR